MGRAAKTNRPQSPAARIRAAVAQAVAGGERRFAPDGLSRIEALESRLLFAAGDLDPTFGGTGKLTLDYFNRNDFGGAVAVQADNKVLLAGWTATGVSSRGNDVTVARYNADGTLDAAFGVGGKVTTHLGSTTDTAYALAVQPDGKIVLAGNARGTTSSLDFAVVRYNPDGSLDAAFGTGGIVRTDLGGNATDQGTAMTLTSDGRIVVVGSRVINGDQQFAAVRYTTAGQLDTTFGGGDGIVIHPRANGAAQAKGVVALADGSLILAGAVFDFAADGSDLAAVRLLSDGSLDTHFGSAGWALVHLGGEAESAAALVVLGGGQIVLAGETANGEVQDVALARLTAGGQLDTSFGGGTGYVITDFAAGIDWTTGALLQSDGRIVIGGHGHVNGRYQMAVARYDAGGSLDASFGTGGVVTVTFDPAAESFGEGMAIDGVNRIVVGGHLARTTGFDQAIMRLENDANEAPSAHPGGPYLVHAGGTVVLNGAGSVDVDGSIVSYDWDLDYDGSSFNVDATGAAPTFSAAGLSGPLVRTVALRVTDDGGATSMIVTAQLTVNAAPAAHAGGSYLVHAGGSIFLDGSGSSDVDGSIVSYEWDLDYDGATFDVDAGGATPTFAAPAGAGGTTRIVALRCVDDRGASTVTTATVTITVPPPAQRPGTAILIEDPNAPGKKLLSVLGTPGADNIRFKVDKKKQTIEVRAGNKKLGTFSGMTRVVIDGGVGNDIIDARGLNVPAMLFGGAGNDALVGGNLHDVLVGGAGDDMLSGSEGNDVLVGGTGRDRMFSFYGNDLMVAGALAFENEPASMSAVLAEWSRTDRTFAQRVTSLTNGGGANGSVKLAGNVADDGATDTLFGTANADWLLTGVNDRVMRIR